MKYIDGFVCSQIDSVIAQSGFCCADDKLFLFINENFLLLRKKVSSCRPDTEERWRAVHSRGGVEAAG